MIRISSSKIKDIAADIDNAVIEGIRYNKVGNTAGLMATFSHNSDNEETARDNIKQYLKKRFPVLRIYVEVI